MRTTHNTEQTQQRQEHDHNHPGPKTDRGSTRRHPIRIHVRGQGAIRAYIDMPVVRALRCEGPDAPTHELEDCFAILLVPLINPGRLLRPPLVVRKGDNRHIVAGPQGRSDNLAQRSLERWFHLRRHLHQERLSAPWRLILLARFHHVRQAMESHVGQTIAETRILLSIGGDDVSRRAG